MELPLSPMLCLPLLSASRCLQPVTRAGGLPHAYSMKSIIMTVNYFLQMFPKF